MRWSTILRNMSVSIDRFFREGITLSPIDKVYRHEDANETRVDKNQLLTLFTKIKNSMQQTSSNQLPPFDPVYSIRLLYTSREVNSLNEL